MTEFYSTYQLFGGHNNQTPSQSPPSMGGSETFNSLAMDDASGISDVLPMPTIPFSSYYSGSIETPTFRFGLGRSFIGELRMNAPAGLAAIANGLDYWHAEGSFEDNDSEQSIGQNPVISAGRNAPHLVAVMAGDALTAFKAGGSLVSLSGTYGWQYGPANPYQTLAQIGGFFDDPPDSLADATEVLTRLQNSLTHPTSRFSLGIDSGGQPLLLDECSFASIGPDARVWIDPGDIGNAVDQIPASVLNNSASKFRFHPSVFLRRTRYVRSIERCHADVINLAGANLGSQPINIRVVNEDPETSLWLIIVDGVSSIVELDHGGVDLRRPRDIWQQIWVPLITGDQSLGNLTILGGGANSVTSGPAATQIRLGYLSYARYLNLNGDSDEQDDTAQA